MLKHGARNRFRGCVAVTMPQRAGGKAGRSFVGGDARALATVWMGAALDGAAACMERRDAGGLRGAAGRGGDSLAAKRSAREQQRPSGKCDGFAEADRRAAFEDGGGGDQSFAVAECRAGHGATAAARG